MIRHYYHVYADGEWTAPLFEHFDALSTITVPIDITIGIVGHERNRNAVIDRLGSLNATIEQADDGWEQFTLEFLRGELSSHDDPILYAHTKGAWCNSDLNTLWRQSMTNCLIWEWRRCLELLEEYDTVGCYWLDPRCVQHPHPNPFYAGNFWWANPGYLRTLPSFTYQDRWTVEWWIGMNEPKAFDAQPGWPANGNFRLRKSDDVT